MKFFLTLIALTLMVAPATADHHEGMAEEMPPMGKPAEMDAIGFMLGEWTVDMSYKLDPASEWTSTKATAVSSPILNGCANRMEFTGDIMGMPFNGVDHTTFNRETGEYESIWIDDMSAKFTVMSGDFEGDTLVMIGTDMYQGAEYLAKATSKKVSNDEVHWSMYMSMDEGETWFENMKMIYKRK